MKKFVLTKKAGMSQIFEPDGKVIPVTLLEVEPNVVTQVKTKEKDGYNAVQIGFSKTKENRLTKALRGHLKNLMPASRLREFRVDDTSSYKRGDIVKADVFEAGDKVVARGKAIGKGFQGVVKRHGFSGGPASHGHRHVLRTPGSIGSMYPQRVFKGKKMAGRMGGGNISVKNLLIVKVDGKKNVIFVRGAVPGKKGAVISLVGVETTKK